MVLIGIMLTVSGVVAYETIRSDTYSSFAQLYLGGEVQLDVTSLLGGEDAMNYFGTQMELLKGPRLQLAAMEKAGIINPNSSAEPDLKKLVRFDVTQPMKTSILQLQAIGPDPLQTQRFLEELLAQYIAFKKETRVATSEEIIASLGEQLAARENKLREEQDKWLVFQKTNNLPVLEEEGRGTGLYLADLNLQLAKTKLEHQLLEETFKASKDFQKAAVALDTASNLFDNIAATNGAPVTNECAVTASTNIVARDDNTLKAARLELILALKEMNEKDKSLNPRNPLLVKLKEDVARYQTMVSVLEEQDLADKKSELEKLEKRQSALQAAIPEWETKVSSVNEQLSQGERLKMNVAREQTAYEHLLGLLQNVDLKRSVQRERLLVVEPPTPSQLSKRYLPIRIALAAVAGVGLSMGFVFVWYLFDDRFVSVRDINDQFGERVLGLIPKIKINRSKGHARLLQAGDSRLVYLESFRHLRSALLLSREAGTTGQTLLFTGMAAGEGKTTIAANLALTLARSGLRVVLVDADAQEGELHELFEVAEQPGLLDCLRGDEEVDRVAVSTSVPGLELVPIGNTQDQTDGLFFGSKTGALIEKLRQGRDFVILDGASIFASDDMALLAPQVGHVILVARPYFSRTRQLRQALDMFYQRQAKQIGIVFNQARAEDMVGQRVANRRSKTTARPSNRIERAKGQCVK